MFANTLKTGLVRSATAANNVNKAKLAQQVLRCTLSTDSGAKIIYTHCDEAPALATYAFLPIIRRFTEPTGVAVELSDISVAGRIIAHFPENLTDEQRIDDELAKLGELVKTPEANVIKLPNVSASIPQLNEAIAELQGKGYDIPNFPQVPTNAEEQAIHDRYAMVLGSAVNPVLREGNSDRRVAGPVKDYAQAHPKKMGAWSSDSKSHVAHMEEGDFYSNEKSFIPSEACTLKIELVGTDGSVTTLKEGYELQAGELCSATFMSIAKLKEYYEKELTKSAEDGLMTSLHLKATMMKVSDPILFGHCVDVFFKDTFAKHADALASVNVDTTNGLGDVYEKIQTLPDDVRAEIEADLMATYGSATRPGVAMVDSRKGITNLHVPSDVIIDASMPNVVRDSGMMWNTDDALEDVKCLIPDRCYARMYQRVIDFCKENGQFDAGTMGNVANVGLMAQKAEEYGSHDKTFELPADGTVRVTDNNGNVIMEHQVEKDDVWRMYSAKDEPIRDWVRLAVARARATGSKAIFWLDEDRAHDANLIGLVNAYLADHDTSGLDISIMKPADAAWESCARAKAGQDTISVTGNVLRDYLTDLFPILELGTSAKMLSIVPLLKGGGLYETGAGGSAPKHVQQFVEEGHLRWDSLGEYLALAVALEELGEANDIPNAKLLGETLTAATGRLLNEDKNPSRKVNEIDNRGSSFYIAQFWAEEMSKSDESFKGLASDLAANADTILQDLIDCQGAPQDIGGYYMPDPDKCDKAMRPSATLNKLIDEF